MKQLSDNELLRYSRTLFLEGVDYHGQMMLKNAKVLVVGAGGLGSSALYYLAAIGVGQLIVSDYDQVELSNLARQIIHLTADIGKSKTQSAKEKITALNPEIEVIEAGKVDASNLAGYLKQVDLVLDCSDNFETRFLINQFAYQSKTPLVSGAALRFHGQVMSFSYGEKSACYQCLFPNSNISEIEENCVDCGVFAPLVGIVGAMEASEAIKILLNLGMPLDSKMLLIDGLDHQFKTLEIKKDPSCEICGG